MKIFYHNDMDGIVSAKIILDIMEIRTNISEKDFFAMDYTTEFPLDMIEEGEEVFIVDYSIPVETMKQLQQLSKRVIWIDHHKSAIEQYKDYDKNILGLRVDGIAGCILTWWYFYGRQVETENFLKDYPKNINSFYRKEIPEFVRLAGDWDVWEHLYGQKTKEFAICFSTKIHTPFDEQLNMLNDERNLEWFLQTGKDMINFRDSWANIFMNRYGFETKINNYSAFLANLGNANSEFFGERIQDYDIIGSFCFDGENWTCSLYSNKAYIDCANICKQYGGGGHKGAAGFVCKELPFKKEEN